MVQTTKRGRVDLLLQVARRHPASYLVELRFDLVAVALPAEDGLDDCIGKERLELASDGLDVVLLFELVEDRHHLGRNHVHLCARPTCTAR